jgi:hypothetical protein
MAVAEGFQDQEPLVTSNINAGTISLSGNNSPSTN